ncbi:MAG: uroporphyrinogen decarboxylase family protein [bacterium]|nr:uroporphyrinogen decarboxylase family protein [bacterium]
MTSKERVSNILTHQEADRLPWDYWADPAVTERLLAHFGYTDLEQLLRHFEVDFRYLTGPIPASAGMTLFSAGMTSFPRRREQELKKYDDGSSADLWGVRRKTITVEQNGFKWSYKHVTQSPLETATTVQEIERYPNWPSPDWWDYSTIAADCDKYKDSVIVNAGDRLDRTAQLKPFFYLRGMEQTYMDLVLNPQIVEALLAHIRDYFLEYNRRVFESAKGNLDIFMMGDDFGTQTGLMFDIQLWRKYFKPGLKAYIELAHRYGIKVMHHTCGAVRELIPDLIDCGLDILQSIQPRAKGMELAELKREFGKDLCFHGGLDIQQTLPYGTADDIRAEVKQRIEAGKSNGGYILCTAHNLPPDTPTENIIALFSAYREFGKY